MKKKVNSIVICFLLFISCNLNHYLCDKGEVSLKVSLDIEKYLINIDFENNSNNDYLLSWSSFNMYNKISDTLPVVYIRYLLNDTLFEIGPKYIHTDRDANFLKLDRGQIINKQYKLTKADFDKIKKSTYFYCVYEYKLKKEDVFCGKLISPPHLAMKNN